MLRYQAIALTLLVAESHSANVDADWVIPMDPQTLSVATGDTVTFAWSGYHNVYSVSTQAEFDGCTRTDATELAPSSSGGSYSITLDTPGTFFYICEVGGHCESGQKLAVTVTNSGGDPSSPSSPPPDSSGTPSPPPDSSGARTRTPFATALAVLMACAVAIGMW